MYKQRAVFLGLLVLAVLAVIVFDMQRSVPMPAPIPVLPTTTVAIGTDSTSSPQATVQAEVASTQAQHRQGLSGRTSLAEGKGMLFVFQQPNRDGFWMKDMQFALDIIWADSSGVIITIAHDISPDTYPTSFYPSAPVLYVLEVPAGFAKVHGVTVGDKIMISH